MRRKLVKHGEKTLMVSLPAKWLKHQGLKKGDEIVITPENSTLTLSKEELLETIKEIKINIQPENKKHARALLGNAYKLGYDEIAINFKGEAQLKLIKQQLNRMIGFEMISLTKNSCLLKSVIKSTIENYESLKKRAWFNIKSAFEILISDMEKQKYNHEATINELYDNTLKFTDFCRRLINKHLFLDVKNSCLEYSILLKLVYTIPLIKDIYFYLIKNKLKPKKDIINFTQKISNLFDLVYQAYYKKDPNFVFQIIKKREELGQEGQKLIKKPHHALIISKLLEIKKLCYGFSGHITAQFFLSEFKE